MKSNTPLRTEGIFSVLDRFVDDFFERLKKGAADEIIGKAKNAKLPPDVLKKLNDINNSVKDLHANLEKYKNKK
jgi:hypothetical protein